MEPNLRYCKYQGLVVRVVTFLPCDDTPNGALAVVVELDTNKILAIQTTGLVEMTFDEEVAYIDSKRKAA